MSGDAERNFQIPPDYKADHRHQELLALLKQDGVLYPWHRFLIAIDGVDGVGKSTLSRYLSWQLGMPVAPLDEYFSRKEADPLALREDHLLAFINARLEKNRPVIVEGIFALDAISRLGLNHDFLIRVIRLEDGIPKEMSGPQNGLLMTKQKEYLTDYGHVKPDYTFVITEEEYLKREFPKNSA